MANYTGKIRLVVKHYPYKYRDYSFLAAQAAEAAREQGKFWEMHDIMLARKKLDIQSLTSYARELGLNIERFSRDLSEQTYLPRIQRDIDLAQKLDFFQTPTFVINGRVLIGERPVEKFIEIIDAELQRTK